MSNFSGDWQAWHDAREQRLRDPQGWLAITAVHWLSDEPERFADVPGEWAGDPDGATVTLVDDESLTTENAVLTKGVHHLGPLDGAGLTVTFDGAVAQVADRDGRVIVRPRHSDSPNLRAYAGTPCYPADPSWVVAARFVPYPEPTDDAVGEVVFDHDGTEHRLTAWSDDDASVDPVPRRDVRRDDVPGEPAAGHRGALDGWRGVDRLQPGPQHAVRVHRLRYLPAAPGGQHAAVRGRGRGEDPDATGVTRLVPLICERPARGGRTHLAKIGTEGTPTSLVSAQSTTWSGWLSDPAARNFASTSLISCTTSASSWPKARRYASRACRAIPSSSSVRWTVFMVQM